MSSMDKYWQLEKGSKVERVYKNLEKQIEKYSIIVGKAQLNQEKDTKMELSI